MPTKQTADKGKTKSKTASVKKVSVSFDKDFYTELNEYASSRGYAVEDYIKKSVKEKLDSDRISSMIDVMTLKNNCK